MAEVAVSPTDLDACREQLDVDGYVVLRSVVDPDKLDRLGTTLGDGLRPSAP